MYIRQFKFSGVYKVHTLKKTTTTEHLQTGVIAVSKGPQKM